MLKQFIPLHKYNYNNLRIHNIASMQSTHYSPHMTKSYFSTSTQSLVNDASQRILSTNTNTVYISICTFNILAPCYRRVATRRLESDSLSEWLKRHTQIVSFLHDMNSSIYCLQEYWFGNPRFRGVYERDNYLTQKYTFHGLCRPNYKEDGIMTMIRSNNDNIHRDNTINHNNNNHIQSDNMLINDQHPCQQSNNIDLKVVDTHNINYPVSGSRVAMILRIQVRQKLQHNDNNQSSGTHTYTNNNNSQSPPPTSKPSQSHHTESSDTDYRVHGELLLANTHLTFPHGLYDNVQRGKQIRTLTTSIDKYIEQNSLTGIATFIVGDMNVDGDCNDDCVYQHLLATGYLSSYHKVHGQEPGVTHLTHRGTQLAVDYIMYRQLPPDSTVSNTSHILPVEPVNSIVLPEGTSNQVWPQHFKLSDHRPLLTTFAVCLQHDNNTNNDTSDSKL